MHLSTKLLGVVVETIYTFLENGLKGQLALRAVDCAVNVFGVWTPRVNLAEEFCGLYAHGLAEFFGDV
jgi:hypothetical protein